MACESSWLVTMGYSVVVTHNPLEIASHVRAVLSQRIRIREMVLLTKTKNVL